MLQLLVEIPMRRARGIWPGESFLNEIARQAGYSLAQLLGGRPNCRSQIRLMKFMPAFCSGGYKGDPEAASPIPEQIREAGGLIILIGTQLRVSNHVDRHEKESIPEPLKRPGKSIVGIVCIEVKCAVVPHRRSRGS